MVAALQFNERYLRRRQSAEEREVKQEQGHYEATDDDLPEIFWNEPTGTPAD